MGTGARKETKTASAVSWAQDIVIATTAWTFGLRLATLDGDFDIISGLIVEAFGGDPLDLAAVPASLAS